jgi:hypothetical protein
MKEKNIIFQEKIKNAYKPLMLHRKIDHTNLVRRCINYLKKKSCWFLHDEEAFESEEHLEKEDEENKNETDLVFQNLFKNMKPPIGGRKTKQKTD